MKLVDQGSKEGAWIGLGVAEAKVAVWEVSAEVPYSTGLIALASRPGTSSSTAIAAAAAATTVRERRLPSCRSPPPRTSTLPDQALVSMTKTPLGPTAT